jgi:hypothetical protein
VAAVPSGLSLTPLTIKKLQHNINVKYLSILSLYLNDLCSKCLMYTYFKISFNICCTLDDGHIMTKQFRRVTVFDQKINK